MTKTLVIVESPAKAKTIGKFLGKNYTVKATMGHIRDLPKSQLGVDIDNDFSMKYINIRGKGELIKDLKMSAKKNDMVLLATDPDREGEAIAWHLEHILNISVGQPCRIVFNEITKKAIKESVKKPRPVDNQLVDAQQARRLLDRLVGYNLSPLLWRKIKRGLSAGRVQSVAVRMICDREDEIQAFVSEEYWSLSVMFKKEDVVFEAKLHKIGQEKAELKTENDAGNIVNDIKNEVFLVKSVKKKKQQRYPAQPFTTSNLQQEAYRKLNFTAKRTMRVAQQLYEGLDLSKQEGTVGLITYIRTDSTRVSTEAREDVFTFIRENYGEPFLAQNPKTAAKKGKIQDAHECIRPTNVSRTPDSIKQYLSSDQYRLYKLVWDRFVASQMAPAINDITTVDISAKSYLFRAAGSIVDFPGYTIIYTESKDEVEKENNNYTLPRLEEKEEVKLEKVMPKQHFTQPPPRYTEATLVKTMEENGIGRPSTYAPTLDTIISRGYVVRDQKQFVPTELGRLIVDLLKNYFKDIVNIEFTANMENKLDEVEEGEVDWKAFVADFYQTFHYELKVAEEEIGRIEVNDEETEEKCEKCGRNMVIKSGRYGKFLACPGFPECRNTKPLLEETGVYCPKCREGKIVVRVSKKGRKFYGCSRFPECDFVSWNEPVEELCPVCHNYLIIKRGKRIGEQLVCSNKECGYKKQLNEK